jgi:hypothetical protein
VWSSTNTNPFGDEVNVPPAVFKIIGLGLGLAGVKVPDGYKNPVPASVLISTVTGVRGLTQSPVLL